MNPPTRAPLGAALALLLCLATLAGGTGVAIVTAVVMVVVVMVAVGWPDLFELPSARGTRIVVALSGIAGALLSALPPDGFGPMLGVATVCAAAVFASFVHQMLRPERTALTASLTGTVAGAVLTGLAGCWIRAEATAASDPVAAGVVTASAAGLCAALLILTIPGRGAIIAPLAVAASTGVSALVLLGLAVPSLLVGTVAGLAVGLGASAAHLLLGSTLVAREPAPSLTVAAAPIATAGVIVLLAARLAS